MNNVLTMKCVEIEDRGDYGVVYLRVASVEGNSFNTYAEGTIGFTLSPEGLTQFEVDKIYDLNLQEIVVSE